MQTITFFARIRSFFTRKRTLWILIGLVVLFGAWYFIFGRTNTSGTIQTGKVTQQDLQKTVLTTGQVVSSTNLDLSFQSSGVVKRINVREGDVVGSGEVLAVLDQSIALAGYESAKANYNKVLAAATPQDVAVSQANVDAASVTLMNAKDNLTRAVSSAYNSANTAVSSYTNILFSSPQSVSPQFAVNGTVQTNQSLVSAVNGERVAVNDVFSEWQKEISGISLANQGVVAQNSITHLSVISTYLSDVLSLLSAYTQVTSGGSQTTVTTHQTNVSTAKSTVDGLITTISTDIQAIRSAESALAQAQATLELKKSPARSEDVDIAKAQMNSAQATLENTILRAPASGTITQVDIKLGEQATAMKEVFKLQNVQQLHAEALVSEADIASVQIGQSVDMTFDALGPDKHFTNQVLTVNPASTVISGVVNYKVTANLNNITNIKPGMTANMTILVAEKKNVLAVPSSAIVNLNGKKMIKVIDDPKTKTYHQVEVQTGLEADAGLTEITAGLSVGQEVVTYIKK